MHIAGTLSLANSREDLPFLEGKSDSHSELAILSQSYLSKSAQVALCTWEDLAGLLHCCE